MYTSLKLSSNHIRLFRDEEFVADVIGESEEGVQQQLERLLQILEIRPSSVKRWMIGNKDDYDNSTNLAEAAAIEFDCDEFLDDPNHWIWDLASEVME